MRINNSLINVPPIGVTATDLGIGSGQAWVEDQDLARRSAHGRDPLETGMHRGWPAVGA